MIRIWDYRKSLRVQSHVVGREANTARLGTTQEISLCKAVPEGRYLGPRADKLQVCPVNSCPSENQRVL